MIRNIMSNKRVYTMIGTVLVLFVALNMFFSIDESKSVSDSDEYYSFEGSLSYINDSDWKDVIRPLAFDDMLLSLDIYSGDTLIDNFKMQSTSLDSEYHLSFIHDGYGGGGFVVSNIPKVVDGKDVTSVKLRVENLPFYQDGTSDAIEFSDEATSVVNTELRLEPYMIPLTIVESVEGDQSEELATFNVKIQVTNTSTNNGLEYESTITSKTVSVTKGGSGTTINIPTGLKYTISQVGRDDYAVKNYGLAYITDNNQIVTIEKNAIDLNPFIANETRGGKKVSKYIVSILNTARNSKVEWDLVWLDNNNVNRPEATFKLQFSVDGAEYVDVTEDVLETLGIESMPQYRELEYETYGDVTKYAYSNLPSIDVNGKPISYKVVQTTVTDEYLFDYDSSDCTFYNTIKTNFVANMRWLDSDANPDVIRPSEIQIRKYLKLYAQEGGTYREVELTSKEMKIEKSGSNDSEWTITITKNLPQYSRNNDKITYMLVEGTIDSTGNVDPIKTIKKSGYVGEEIYNVSYYNSGSTEIKPDRCFNEQLILHILKSDYRFVTTKIWNDDEQAVRPEAMVTLWRYPVTNPKEREIDLSSSARVITQDKDENDIVLQYVLNTSGKKVSDLNVANKYEETLSFSKANIPDLPDDFSLPKYDPAGNEYIYFVVETSSGGENGTYYSVVYKDNKGKELEVGATLGGKIISTRSGSISLEVNKLWNAASTAQNINGAKVSFEVIGKEQGTTTYKELGVMKGNNYIDGFGISKLRDKTEILINPYDSKGRKYEDIIVKEKSITINGKNIPLSFSTQNKDEWSFTLGSDTYEGKCGKLVKKGNSVIYEGVEMYGVNVTNTVITPKKYSIVVNWDKDIAVEERTGQTLAIKGVSIKNVEEGEEPTTVLYSLSIKNNAEEVNGTMRGTAVLTDEKGNSIEVWYTESLDDSGNTIWTIEELPGFRMYDKEGYLIDYRVISVKNDVPEGTTVTWFSTFSTNSDGALIRNTMEDDHEVYVHGTKMWNDGGDVTSRYDIKLVITDPKDTSIPAQILKIDSTTFWHNFIKFPENYFPSGVVKGSLDIKEILVGPDGKEYKSYEGEDGNTYITTDLFTYKVELEQYNAATKDPSAPESGNVLGVTVTNTRVDQVDFIVENIWKDGEDQSSTRPEKIVYEIIKYDIYGNIVDKMKVELDGKDYSNGELWTKTITKLDKYDEYGRKYDYYIKEIPVYDPPNTGEYKLNLEYNFLPGQSVPNNIEGYKYGDNKQNDKIIYTCTNYLEAKTSFFVYQKWLDDAIDSEDRPDMYMTVYKRNRDNVAGPDIPIEESMKNQIWTSGSADADYTWKIEFTNLDKYDENGYLNEYYVIESMNDIEEAGLKYYIEYRDDKYELTNNNYAESKGYIVNTLYDTVIISGEKIWKNVAGYNMSDMPDIIIDLYRTDPQGNELLMNSVSLQNGATLFSFDKQIKEDGTELELQKYTDKGEAYKYSIREHKNMIIAPGDCEEGDDDEIYNLFSISYDLAHNTIINEFNRTTNTRSITVTKKWNRDDVQDNEKDIYPKVTMRLYRYIGEKTTDTSHMTYMGARTVSAKSFAEATNGEVDITFDNILIYSPKGSRYSYFIQEDEISEAYTSEYSVDGTSADIIVEDNGISFRDVKRMTDDDKESRGVVTNIFDAHNDKKLQGGKIWNDYFDFYKLRPDSINIDLSRGATASDGNNRVPEIKLPLVVKDAEDTSEKEQTYIVWNKNVVSGGNDTWQFTVYNVPKYAANGQPYQYYVRENDKTVRKYYSADKFLSNNMSRLTADNVLSMGFITNSFTVSHTVKKHWIDGNNIYNYRPKNVTMELEFSKDNGTTWEKMLRQNGSQERISCVLTSRDVVANTRGNTWRNSFGNLPSHQVFYALNIEKTQLVKNVWDLEEAIKAQQEIVDPLKQDYENKESSVAQLQTIYDAAFEKLNAANEAVEKAQKDYDIAEKTMKDAEAAIVAARKAVAEAYSAFIEAQKELEQKNSDHEAAQLAVEEAVEKLDSAQEELNTAKKKYSDASAEFEDANNNLGEARTKLSEANAALETAKTAHELAEEELANATSDEEKEQAQKALEQAEATLFAAQNEADEAKKKVEELEYKISVATDNMSLANEEIDAANEKVIDTKNEVKDLEIAEKEAEDAVADATSKLTEANNALSNANAAHTNAESELEGAKRLLDNASIQLDTAKDSAQQLQNKADEEEAKLNSAIGERDLAKAAYDAANEELKNLQDELSKAKKAVEDAGITMPTNGNPEIWEDMPIPVIYRCVETKIGNSVVPESKQVGSYVVSNPTVKNNTTEIKNSMQSTKLTVLKDWDDVDNYYQTRFNKTYYKLQRIAQYALPQEESASNTQQQGALVTLPMPQDTWEQVYDVDGKPTILELTSDDMCRDENGVYNWWKKIFYNLPVAREGDITKGEEPIVKLYYRVVECTNEDLNPQLVTVNKASDGTYSIDGHTTYKHYRDVTVYDMSWKYDTDAKTNSSTIVNHMITKEDVNEETGSDLVAEIAAEKRWAKDINVDGYNVEIELTRAQEGGSSYSSFPRPIKKTILYNGVGVSWNNLPAYNENGVPMFYKAKELTEDKRFRVHTDVITSDIDTGKRELYKFTNIQQMEYIVKALWNKNDRLLPKGEQNFESRFIFQKRITDTGVWENMKYSNGNDWIVNLTTQYGTTKSQHIKYGAIDKYTVDNKRIYYRGVETHINGVIAADNKAYITSNVDAEVDGDVYTDDGTTVLSHTLRTESLVITKNWDDDNDCDGVRPKINDKSKMNITVYADLGDGYTVVPTSFYTLNWQQSEDNQWKATISEMPKYNKTGNVLIKYKIVETTVPYRYFISRDDGVPEFKDEVDKYDYYISNTLTLLIRLKKYDEVNSKFLNGTQFKLYKFDDATGWYTKQIGNTLTVGLDGYVNFEMSQPGDFVLVETKAVKGYELLLDENGEPDLVNGNNFQCYFSVKDNNLRQTLYITNKLTQEIDKPTPDDYAEPEAVSNEDKEGGFTAAVLPPKEDVYFSVIKGWYNQVTDKGLANKRKLGELTFTKQDENTAKKLNGIVFALYRYENEDGTGNPIHIADIETGKNYICSTKGDLVITEDPNEPTADGKVHISKLPWGKYWMDEISTLSGYRFPTGKHTFVVNASTVNDATSINENIVVKYNSSKCINNAVLNEKTKFKFYKRGYNNCTLTGGKFKIVSNDEAKTEQRFWRNKYSDNEAEKESVLLPNDMVYGLPVGSYRVVEVEVPYGYKPAPDVVFSINEYGWIVNAAGVNTKNRNVIMVDDAVKVDIINVDEDFITPINGSTFELTGKFANATGSAITNVETRKYTISDFKWGQRGNVLPSFPGEEKYVYKLEQIAVPTGYELQPQVVYFIVNENYQVELTDENGNTPNAELQELYDLFVKTDNDATVPSIIFENLRIPVNDIYILNGETYLDISSQNICKLFYVYDHVANDAKLGEPIQFWVDKSNLGKLEFAVTTSSDGTNKDAYVDSKYITIRDSHGKVMVAEDNMYRLDEDEVYTLDIASSYLNGIKTGSRMLYLYSHMPRIDDIEGMYIVRRTSFVQH